jgi:hypothetical protein
MRKILFWFLLAVLSYSNLYSGQSVISNYYKYMQWHNPMHFPPHRMYLRLATYSLSTQFYFCIRQGSSAYPGDYFYPPDAFSPRDSSMKIFSTLTKDEILSISNFLKDNFNSVLSYTSIISSLKCYDFDYPTGHHREPYTMLTDADTIYVISGWLDKFLSFYRVVPGDKRLTIPELMKELEKITPLSKEIDQKKFRTESDSVNYLIEYVDKVKRFRVRNYLMKATLPPDAPDALESYHNLIEVTKFIDKGMIP